MSKWVGEDFGDVFQDAIVSGGGSPKAAVHTFTAGSTETSFEMVAVPSGSSVTIVNVTVKTAFNGAATLTVGTISAPSKCIAVNENDLEEAQTYISTPIDVFNTSTPIIAFFDKGASSLGEVEVEVCYA